MAATSDYRGSADRQFMRTVISCEDPGEAAVSKTKL